MTARIFRPSPNAMQSGKANSKLWILEHEPAEPRQVEPLMGYTSSSDMQSQVRLKFESLEDAEAYARKNGLAYVVQQEQVSTPKRVAYTDNFKHDRKSPWTH
jgi:hypothetical protein